MYMYIPQGFLRHFSLWGTLGVWDSGRIGREGYGRWEREGLKRWEVGEIMGKRVKWSR